MIGYDIMIFWVTFSDLAYSITNSSLVGGLK